MKKWLFWDLLTGVKIVCFYDISMSIITVFFMLLSLILGTNGASLILQFLDFIFVITPRTMIAFYIVRRLYPKRIWRISCFLRLATIIPSLIFEIIQLSFDANSDGGSKGTTIAFGVIFLIANLLFSLFWAYALWSYYKNGVEPSQQIAEAAAQAIQAAQANGTPQPQMGIPVGGRPLQQPQNNFMRANYYNEEVLEGKDPQTALEKQYDDIKLSLNGGIDDNNPEQEFGDDPIGNQDNEGFSGQDTPPDYDQYQSMLFLFHFIDEFSNKNKVVNKNLSGTTGPQPFPQGRFL